MKILRCFRCFANSEMASVPTNHFQMIDWYRYTNCYQSLYKCKLLDVFNTRLGIELQKRVWSIKKGFVMDIISFFYIYKKNNFAKMLKNINLIILSSIRSLCFLINFILNLNCNFFFFFCLQIFLIKLLWWTLCSASTIFYDTNFEKYILKFIFYQDNFNMM